MTTKNYLSALALMVATLLSSCSDNGDALNATHTNPNFPQDGVMRFTSSVTAATQTRAGLDNANIANQTIFLWVTPQQEPSSSLYIYKAVNLHYDKDSWGTYAMLDDNSTWTPTTLLWKNKVTKIDVVAATNSAKTYTMGMDLPTDEYCVVTTAQDTEEGIASSDKLYFKGTIDPVQDIDADGKILLNMNHACSKLKITLTMGTEFSQDGGAGRESINPLSKVKIGDAYIEDQFSMSAGTFNGTYLNESAQPSTTAVITPFANAYTAAESAGKNAVAQYECILIPQTVAAGKFYVSFTIDGKDYKWTSSTAVTLESGKEHQLKLRAGKDIVTVARFSADPWNDETDSNLITY